MQTATNTTDTRSRDSLRTLKKKRRKPNKETETQTLHTQQQIIVETDVLRVVIDTLGGDVRKLDLLNYPVDVKKPEEKFRLLNDSNNNIFIVKFRKLMSHIIRPILSTNLLPKEPLLLCELFQNDILNALQYRIANNFRRIN